VKIDQLREGEPRRVEIIADRRDAWMVERGVQLGSVWLVRRGEKILSCCSFCPHLGCAVTAVPSVERTDGPGGKGFACPCHTSAFDEYGKRTSGPSPRDLDALETKVEDGHAVVSFRRFRIGIE